MKTIIYAPNIHTGGGYVLLKELILAWPRHKPVIAFMDARIKDDFALPAYFDEIYWVYPTIWSRLSAEYKLSKVGVYAELIFCCNGLPPIFPSDAKIVSNLQNINYLKDVSNIGFSKKVCFRLFYEKFIFKFFNDRIDQFFVQTQSMQNELVIWRKKNRIKGYLDCVIYPYVKGLLADNAMGSSGDTIEWDFIYVSDGVAHKNHQTLFEAWALLAKDGIHPTLAITLSGRDSITEKLMLSVCNETGAKIHNLGYLNHDKVLSLYSGARALIYPSMRESFGLPLIEANFYKLPILAPELDYVRDVCTPVQTFDPLSPLSIARSVKRFLGVDQKSSTIYSASEFICKLLERP